MRVPIEPDAFIASSEDVDNDANGVKRITCEALTNVLHHTHLPSNSDKRVVKHVAHAYAWPQGSTVISTGRTAQKEHVGSMNTQLSRVCHRAFLPSRDSTKETLLFSLRRAVFCASKSRIRVDVPVTSAAMSVMQRASIRRTPLKRGSGDDDAVDSDEAALTPAAAAVAPADCAIAAKALEERDSALTMLAVNLLKNSAVEKKLSSPAAPAVVDLFTLVGSDLDGAEHDDNAVDETANDDDDGEGAGSARL